MPRTIDLAAMKGRASRDARSAMARYDDACTADLPYLLLRWISQMTAVELHAVWERYAELRLIAALNHDPSHFLKEFGISGVSRVTSGLASFIVRAGGRFFDFRSTPDLIAKADRWLGKTDNPFRKLSPRDRAYLDTLAAIRNHVVHRSDAARAAYRRVLRLTYGIASAPLPEEFLHAKDMRAASPSRYKSRLDGLAAVVIHAVGAS